MPVYTLEVPGGQRLDIEAGDEASAIRGAQEWYAQNGTATSGLGDALRQGLSSAASGVGETLKQTGIAPSVGDALQSGAQKIAPATAPDTTIISKDGVNLANAPRMVAEQAPGLAAVIAAAKLGARVTPGGAVAKAAGGLVAGAAAGASMLFGPKVKENAAERTGDPNAEPNTADKTRAALTTLPEAAVGALGVSRFLPGAGKVTTTGLKGAGDALKQAAVRVGDNAAAGAAQDVVSQTGKTIGTDKGLSIDPYQVANSAASGGITAGALAAPKAAADIRGAVRDRHFGGENADATTQVANRIKTQADNAGANLRDTRAAFDATTATKNEISNELRTEISGLKQRGTYGPDTVNALDRAASGTATKVDLAHITQATQADPSSALVSSLARQAVVMNRLLRTGDTHNGRFKGGVSAMMERQVRPIANPLGAGAVGVGSLLASQHLPLFGMYSAPALGAAAGGYALARGVDRLTGARSPANRFVNKFADGSTPVRPAVPAPPAPPAPPSVGPTGPKIAPTPAPPWGYPAPPPPNPQQLIAQMNALVNARNVARKQTTAQAMPLLRQLAAQNKPVEPQEQPPTDSVPRDVLSRTKSLVSGLQKVAALKQKTQGENQANAEAASSPFLEQVGGPSSVANPEAGKRMSQMISAAKAMKTLRSDPVAEAEAAATEKAETAAAKAEVRAAKDAERAASRDQREQERKARAEAKTQALAQRLAAQATKNAERDAAVKAKDAAKAAAQEAKARAQAEKLAAKAAKTAAPKAEAKVAPKAEPEAPFTPKGAGDLPFYGHDHDAVADAKLKNQYGSTKGYDKERAAIIRGRARDEALIAPLIAKAPVKFKGILTDVREELHHSSSRSYTKQMRDHFAAMLPKELGDELRSVLSDAWINDPKHKHRP